jgi:hypothetical protein
MKHETCSKCMSVTCGQMLRHRNSQSCDLFQQYAMLEDVLQVQKSPIKKFSCPKSWNNLVSKFPRISDAEFFCPCHWLFEKQRVPKTECLCHWSHKLTLRPTTDYQLIIHYFCFVTVNNFDFKLLWDCYFIQPKFVKVMSIAIPWVSNVYSQTTTTITVDTFAGHTHT